MRQRDAGRALRGNPFVRKATPRLSGTADSSRRPLTRASLLCLISTSLYRVFEK